MSELPITRVVRWWMHRNDRPASAKTCTACGVVVGEHEGEWVPRWCALICSEPCAFDIQASYT
jgi:hypothetical protein